jgi:glycosyltransferase involved in cell wall biosynthesis
MSSVSEQLRPVDTAAAPLVSVIVPVYKRLQYLRQAIESALGQTHPRTEVIVVDDGSPIDPGPVVSTFGPAVRLVRKANGGLASARNFGIAHAAGECLSFLDDDDFLEPDAIQVLVESLARTPGAVWAAGKYRYVNEDGRPADRKRRCQYGSGDVYERMIFNNLMGAPSVVLVRKDAMVDLGSFDETFLLSEDWDMWLALARDFPLVAVDKVVTNYRLHGQQISKTQWARHLEYHLRVMEKHQARARPASRHLFDRGIGNLHLQYGDKLYVAGECRAAREHWMKAAGAGLLSPLALHWRLARSRLPLAMLGVLRAGAARLRGLRTAWGRRRAKWESDPSAGLAGGGGVAAAAEGR